VLRGIANSSAPRRFPPPWTVEEQSACFVVRDHNGQALAPRMSRVLRRGYSAATRKRKVFPRNLSLYSCALPNFHLRMTPFGGAFSKLLSAHLNSGCLVGSFAMGTAVDFKPSWTKIQGANSEIDRLRKLTSPLDRSLYEIAIEKKRGPFIYLDPPVYHELAFRPKEPIPEQLANIIGHVCGDLRSALDYAAHRIVHSGLPDFDPKKQIYFPAAPRKDLPAHFSLAPIDQALPGFKKLLLEQIRPENGPNEHLWSFTEMSNDNKHNDFIPVVTVVQITGINANIGGNILRDCVVGGDAAGPIKIARSDPPIAIKNNFQTAVEVKFGKGTSLEDDPVIPTLSQISEIVAEALKAVERLCNG
jgi:hypothetical protein